MNDTRAPYEKLLGELEAAKNDSLRLQAAIRLQTQYPQSLDPYCRLADLQHAAGLRHEAIKTVQRGLARFPNEALLLARAKQLKMPMARAPQEELSDIARRHRKEAEQHLAAMDAAAARAALERAISAGQPKDGLRIEFARVALIERDTERGLALLAEEENASGASEELVVLRGKLEKRVRALARVKAAPLVLKSAATTDLKEWADLRGIPTGEANAKAVRLITPAGDLLIERTPKSKALVLVFGGLSSMFGDTAEDLSFMVKSKRINAIYVSDPKRLFCLAGFTSVGDYPQTLAWLREVADAWCVRKLYCLGISGGGYPALRYGLDIGATRVLTFAAPTEISPTITQVDKRATALAHRVLTLAPEMCVNLRDEIARRGADAPEIINYYGTGVPEDAYHGRNIEGLPTVRSRPIAGLSAHAVTGQLKADGSYKAILDEFLRDSED